MYVTFPFSNLATETNTDHIMMRSSQLQNVICKGSSLSDPPGKRVFLKDFFLSPGLREDNCIIRGCATKTTVHTIMDEVEFA